MPIFWRFPLGISGARSFQTGCPSLLVTQQCQSTQGMSTEELSLPAATKYVIHQVQIRLLGVQTSRMMKALFSRLGYMQIQDF